MNTTTTNPLLLVQICPRSGTRYAGAYSTPHGTAHLRQEIIELHLAAPGSAQALCQPHPSKGRRAALYFVQTG